MSDEQVAYVTDLLRRHPDIRTILEIGFNGGLSAAAMLEARDDTTVVSFDIGRWEYVRDAKALVDEKFPGRHTLVVGDSVDTVPRFDPARKGTFDLAFIDGGHEAPVPAADIRNTLEFLKPGALVLVDDYCAAYGRHGVIDAYDDAVAQGWYETVEGPFEGTERRGWIVARKVLRNSV